MSKQLDDELRKRISEVFEHYEDTTPAEAGWAMLREKFPANKKRSVLASRWWSAAAVLLLLTTFGLWFFSNQPQKNKLVIVKPHSTSQQSSSVETLKPAQTPALKEQGIMDKDTHNTITSGSPYLAKRKKLSSTNRLPLPYTIGEEKIHHTTTPNITVTSPPLLAARMVDRLAPAEINRINNGIIPGGNKADSAAYLAQRILPQQVKPNQKAASSLAKDSLAGEEQSKMAAYLANEQKREQAQKSVIKERTLAENKILYSVYAATYFNYADGSKSQINTGAGFSTDIKLFSNFKLSTGVSIGRNTLDFSGQPSQPGIASAAARARNKNAPSDAAPSISNTTLGFVELRIINEPVLAGYNVSLTGLDVPINLKYEFNPAKTDSYISAGLSSGTFINETYNYRFDNSVNALGASPSIPDASSNRSFARFDFARTLNVSLGMGYQITKSNRLVIEPFLKYPLSGLGSEQIRFGAGGINLRLKFQGAKKK